MADKNLDDRKVKLVEYSLVTTERERETLLDHGQELITKQMTGEAYANTRIARWVHEQECDGHGLHLDLDTLHVYYNVLERWPKRRLKFDEKTIDYDAQELEVLRQIRQAVAGDSPDPEPDRGSNGPRLAAGEQDPFRLARLQIQRRAESLIDWRGMLAGVAEPLGEAIAAAFDQDAGTGHFKTRSFSARQITEALKQPVEASREDFDQSAGLWRLDSRTFRRGKGEQTGAAELFVNIDQSRETGDGAVQRVALAPGAPPTWDQPGVAVLAFQDPRIGLATWVEAGAAGAEALIGFRLAQDAHLWIGKRSQGDPTLDPGDHFQVAYVWRGQHQGEEAFFQVPNTFRIDLGTGEAKIEGDQVTKNLHLLITASPANPSIKNDAFELARSRIERNAKRFKQLRSQLQDAPDSLAEGLAELFAGQKGRGHFEILQLDAEKFAKALREDELPDQRAFDRFSGVYTTDLRIFAGSGGARIQESSHTTREAASEAGDALTQRVVVSQQPNRSPDEADPTTDAIALGYLSPELGLVTLFEQAAINAREALAAFPISVTRQLWIGQDVDSELAPIGDANAYRVSLMWRNFPNKDFFQVSLEVRLDFEQGGVERLDDEVVMVASRRVE